LLPAQVGDDVTEPVYSQNRGNPPIEAAAARLRPGFSYEIDDSVTYRFQRRPAREVRCRWSENVAPMKGMAYRMFEKAVIADFVYRRNRCSRFRMQDERQDAVVRRDEVLISGEGRHRPASRSDARID